MMTNNIAERIIPSPSYWKVGNSVESHSFPHEVPNGELITKEEYDAFIASLPVIEPKPVRDLTSEIDKIKTDIIKLQEVK